MYLGLVVHPHILKRQIVLYPKQLDSEDTAFPVEESFLVVLSVTCIFSQLTIIDVEIGVSAQALHTIMTLNNTQRAISLRTEQNYLRCLLYLPVPQNA